MKLAFCLFKYFPYGGLQRKMLNIAGLCHDRGHSIDIFVRSWEGPKPDNITLHQVTANAWSNHGKNEAYAKTIRPMLEAGGYDAVVGFNRMPGLDIYYAADACYIARIHHTKPWFYRLTPRYRHFIRFERAVFEPQAGVTVMLLSQAEQQNFMTWYKTPTERFCLLPPGIHRDRMAPDNAAEIRAQWRSEFGICESDKVILMVGSNFHGKGLGRTLSGMAALPAELRNRTRLMVVGKDKPEPFLRMADRLGLRDRLEIFLGRDDVSRFYLGADLFVHPAHVGETAGNVILEAVISGLPVLVTESCGYAFHVEKANAGLLVPLPFQQIDFNEKLRIMLLSGRHRDWSRNGIEYGRAEDLYSLPEVAADLIEATAQVKVNHRMARLVNTG